MPLKLHNLGLTDSQLHEHTAYDIGAEATARHLASRLDIPLLIQRYSRLLIDCNRPPTAADAMPAVIHGTTVPGNKDLSENERKLRVDEVFTPYDAAVGHLLDTPQCRWAFSIHSFTPRLNGQQRPWDIGFLFRKDQDTSARLAEYFNSRHPSINVGLNQPYTVDDESDWFVPQHAERLGLQHSLIEIRNDHISSSEGQQFWATLLADAIDATLD